MNRLSTPFGDDGTKAWLKKPEEPFEIMPFAALYKFSGRIWCVTIWAHTWPDATIYAKEHGLTIHGQYTRN